MVNDLWIAAIALANDLPLVTQDDDFNALADLGLLEVVRVWATPQNFPDKQGATT